MPDLSAPVPRIRRGLLRRAPARRTIAVILSAGQGSRMGAPHNKVFLPLAGKPLLVYTIEAFAQARAVDEIVLVAHPREVEQCEREIVRAFGLTRVRAVVAGGASRHQSEDCALESLRPRIMAGAVDVILVHDGARPFVRPDDITRLIQAAQATGGALLGTPLSADEVLVCRDPSGAVLNVYPHGNGATFWRAQTPQAFGAEALLAAYDQARADGFEGTDTASSYERLGHPVCMVAGQPANLKITTPDDLLRAEALMRHEHQT